MSLAVVKRFRILETVKIVALQAIGGHFTLMIVVMTCQAGFIQTQIRGLFLFEIGVRYVFGIVAFLAV